MTQRTTPQRRAPLAMRNALIRDFCARREAIAQRDAERDAAYEDAADRAELVGYLTRNAAAYAAINIGLED